MADSPPPLDTLLETLKKNTETIAGFIQMVVGWIREKKWVELISLILASIIIAYLSRAAITQFLGEQNSKWFVWICLVVALLFTVAVAVAVLAKPKPADTAANFVERKAIKGLRPFTQADQEIFSQLERQQDLRECLNALENTSFRFGYLIGESGTGKTSFLQAGLLPKLLEESSKAKGIYIKFSDQDPLETVRRQLGLEKTVEGDFLSLLFQSVAAAGKPLILLFDQFEQFFVHRRTESDRQPFLLSLQQWYNCTDPPEVKILFSIRADLYYNLIEIQKILGYSPSPFEVCRLKKFSPEQAANVLGVIAKTENLEFDRRFIREVAQQELASREDGLISPVDLQILAWMLERQNTKEMRGFSEKAFQQLGGIEGLLKRYLETTLDARITPQQRQATLQTLLALTDLDQQVRVGALTVEQIQDKLKDTVKAEDVAEATTWLARPDVRLISPTEQAQGITAYELAHERVIPALMQLSGKELTEANRANKLLDTRVNEWLGSNFSSRYLLDIREIWLIERQKPYLIWGSKQRQKENLIKASKRRIQRIFGVIGAILLLIMGVWSWLTYTPSGQIWQIRRDLVYWSDRVEDDQYQAQAAIAFTKDNNEAQASKLVEKIGAAESKIPALRDIAQVYSQLKEEDKAVNFLTQALEEAPQADEDNNLSYSKVDALNDIAQAASQLKPEDRAVSLLTQAFDSARQLKDDFYKATVLSAIAQAYSQLKQEDKAVNALTQALDSAREIKKKDSNKVYALSAIAEAASQLKQEDKAVTLLNQAFDSARQLKDDSNKVYALSAIAQAYSQLKQEDKAANLLSQALDSARQISKDYYKAYALMAIAQAYSQLKQEDRAVTLLNQAFDSARQISEDSDKTYALNDIAEAASQLKQEDKAVTLLNQAFDSARQISEDSDKTYALNDIAEAASQLKQEDKAVTLLNQAFDSARQLKEDSDKGIVLSAIAQAASQLKQEDKAVTLLSQALDSARLIKEDSNKATVLMAIAEAYSQLQQEDKAANLLSQALDLARQIEGADNEANALIAIAQAEANLKNWRKALEVTRQCPSHDCRVASLSKVLTVHAEQQHPELKEKKDEE